MMEILGIDEKSRDLKSKRNWKKMKKFLGLKMVEVMEISDGIKESNASNRLHSTVL